MQIRIRAVPQSKKFAVSRDARITVKLKSDAKNNLANTELVNGVAALLGCPVRLVSGMRSANKVLEVGCTEQQFESAAKIKLQNGDIYGKDVY